MKRNQKKLCGLVYAYFDGQLHEEDVTLFEKHRKACDTCRAELQRLAKVNDFLHIAHSQAPEPSFFNAVWERVEKNILREKLSVRDRVPAWQHFLRPRLVDIWKPAIAISFVFLLVMLPLFEQVEKESFPEQESEVRKIESDLNNILLLKTKNKNWDVIWMVPIAKQEEVSNV